MGSSAERLAELRCQSLEEEPGHSSKLISIKHLTAYKTLLGRARISLLGLCEWIELFLNILNVIRVHVSISVLLLSWKKPGSLHLRGHSHPLFPTPNTMQSLTQLLKPSQMDAHTPGRSLEDSKYEETGSKK